MDQITVKRFPVTGLHCANCALNVEKALNRQPGVKTASVNFADGSATVELLKGAASPAEIQSAIRAIGYDLIIEEGQENLAEEEHRKYYRKIRSNTIGSIILATPVMVISMFFMNMEHANYIMLLLTLPVLAWFGRSFFVNAVKQARHAQANMDTLVALSTGIAFLFSVFNTFNPHFWHAKGLHPHVYYEASAMVIAFILLGKMLEERAKSNTSSAIKKLMGLQPDTVYLIRGSEESEIPVSRVKPGDHLRIKPGNRIPVDGEILTGNSYIDESTMTGEALPAEKSPGDQVYAGTLNQDGSFILVARQVGSATLLSRIIDMVRKAQGSKAPVQKTVDKIAGIFVPVVMMISLLSFVTWMIFGGGNALTHALLAMVTVLVIACPCALGLATPTALMVGMGKGAQQGILIKDADSLERIHKVNAVVLDKTGTITEGKPIVTDIIWNINDKERGLAEPVLLSMEMHSSHPLAGAVVAHFTSIRNNAVTLTRFENLSGRGVKAQHENLTYAAGNLKLMVESGVVIDPETANRLDKLQENGGTVICFAKGNRLIAFIVLEDRLKSSSAGAIRELQANGIEVFMLTGDNECTAKAVAAKTNIRIFKSGFLPEDKAGFVAELQKEGRLVAMVGDGINDSQALAVADVSIAMGKGSDIAMDVAGMTLVSSDLGNILKAIRLSGITVRTIRQNLFWAFIYNLVGIPIAAGVLYPVWGFMLNPMIAAAAMAMSSVSVVSNSLRLRGKKI